MKNETSYKISVITPVYNGERFLEQTIKNLLDAGKENMQIVLVDDGSKDQSGAICEEYQKKYSNILYCKKENGGIVSARNKGIELALGEYLCFCDQDDIVEPDFFEIMLQRIEENQCDIAICGTNRYVGGEKIACEQFSDRILEGEDVFKEVIYPVLFYGSDLGKPPHERWVGTIWKCMIRKELVETCQIQFRRHVNYEDDLLFYIDVLTHARGVCLLSYVGYNWRINHDSETYNWKYIEGYCDKYNNFIEDMIEMISRVCSDEKIINSYRYYQLCTMYEEFILNEGSIHNKKKLGPKIRYIKTTIIENDYKNAITFRNHIRKTSLRKRIALILVGHKHWLLAYLWLVNYKKLRERAIRHKGWFELEKKIKEKVK